jgi:hypothetical protein
VKVAAPFVHETLSTKLLPHAREGAGTKSLTLYNLKVEIMAGARLAPVPAAAPLPSFVNWTPMPLRQSALHSSN